MGLLSSLRQTPNLSTWAIEQLAGMTQWLPAMNRRLHAVERHLDIGYSSVPHPQRQLDIWRSKELSEPAPALIFIHGGGFRILSKRTHWLMALLYAEAGYVVFSVDYRLAPQNPFPAAVEDVCEAYCWVRNNAERYGAQRDTLILAGESAGANLVVVLAIAACFERQGEPYTRQIFDEGVVPRAIIPMCGYLQLSEPHRFADRRMPRYARRRIHQVSEDYLRGSPPFDRENPSLADPLLILEALENKSSSFVSADPRPFPATYLSVGTRDPIEEDTHRLAKTLQAHPCPLVLDVYEREPHGFQALIWRDAARQCWRAQRDFLNTHVRRC